MHSHCRSALSLAAAIAAAGLAVLPAAAQTTTTLVSGPSWNTTSVSGASLGGAQYVVVNSQSPAVQPAGATNYGGTTSSAVWLANISSIPGAYWIWAPGITGATPNASLAQYSFSQQFFLAGAPQSGTFSIAVDDYAAVYVNGTQVGSIGSVTDVSAAYQAQSSLTTFNIAPFLTAGQNTIVVNAENGPASFAGAVNPPYSVNTAGVVFGGSITSAPAAVPEASTTISFGLLMLLGGAFFGVKKKAMHKAGE